MDFKNSPVVVKGSLPGKRLVILAGVHGDEPCGVQALEKIISNLKIIRGQVTFILGNPNAVKENKRFIDVNLNRMFRSDTELSTKDKNSYEYKRSRELMPFLEEADAMLDIHSSGTPNSVPFIICEPQSFSLAEKLPVDIISYGWDEHEPGGTDYFVNKSGGLGLCIECGYHLDPKSHLRAEAAVYDFLSAMEAIEEKVRRQSDFRMKKYLEVYYLYKTDTGFIPARDFSDFDTVSENELIGNDGSKEVRVPEVSMVLFVRERKNSNEEAFLLVRESLLKK